MEMSLLPNPRIVFKPKGVQRLCTVVDIPIPCTFFATLTFAKSKGENIETASAVAKVRFFRIIPIDSQMHDSLFIGNLVPVVDCRH